MDIGSKHGYPSSALSNFAPHPFVFDEIPINSMEGFLQSLKFKNPEMQKEICKLVGYSAKKSGKEKKWWKTQTLYWEDKEIDRQSDEYQILLDRAYMALMEQSDSFRRALLASGDAVLTHNIGRSNSKETILTRSEFCGRLMRLREILKKKNNVS